ncbi:MAG: serine hydrolase [Prolixibacteraceae bacterium]|nr:serine hydrolase [Prolixibacteraceae bacterium]
MKIAKIKTITLLFISFLSLFSCRQTANDILYDRKYMKEIKQSRKQAAMFLTSNFIPGGNFAVAKDGKIIYSEGLGLASKDLEVPATRDTRFRIGELSELLTSTIFYKMVESGTLHPDSAVQHYYPEFPEKQFRLPVKHLLYHTSGIKPAQENEQYINSNTTSIQKGIDFFKNDTLVVSPGVYEFHTIYNYNLLGAIMEKVSNKKFSEILKEYVTDTLYLENTVPDNPFSTIPGRSNFFDYNLMSQTVNAVTRDLRYCAPSVGLLSNAEDLVKFGNALLYSEFFSEDMKKKLFEPYLLNGKVPTQMSNGWFVMNDRSGRTIYGKSGGVAGGGASLIIYPEEKLVVACAINLTSLTEEYPVFEIAANFLPEDKEETSDSKSNNENDK